MKRDRLGLVVLASVGSLACPSRGPILDPQAVVVVSACGKDRIPTLVHPRITLYREKDLCKAAVAPEELCIYRGDVIRWQVYNHCGVLEGRARPALAVVRLTALDRAPAATWFMGCRPSLGRVLPGADAGNRISCRIPESAPTGKYKYSLEGAIETLDPGLEVLDPN